MLPWVIIYNAVSLDGRITGFHADVELYYELASEWDVDAVLMGSNTVLKGFNVRPGEVLEENEEKGGKNDGEKYGEKGGESHGEGFQPPQIDPEDQRPLLVVPDSKGRIRIWNELRKMPYLRDILVLCSRSTPQEYLDFLDQQFIKYLIVGYRQVDLETALEELNLQFGVKKVRVDSGGVLNGVLLRDGLVDEVNVLVHPELVGGTSPSSIYQAPDLDSSGGVLPLVLVKVQKLKDEIIWLQYKVFK